MADLVQVRVQDFRAFSEASFDLPDGGLVLVAGQNNAGKSALLSALDVIAGQQEQNAVRNAAAEGPAHVWARFRLTERERAALLGVRPGTPGLQESRIAEWVEWDFSEIADDVLQALTMSIAWTDGEARVVAELRVPSPHSWELWGPNTAQLAEWTPGVMASVRSGSGGRPGRVLEQAHGLTALTRISTVLDKFHESYFHFKPLRQGVGRTVDLASAPRLLSDGSNLAQVLHHLQSNKPRVWRELSRLIEEIVPGVGTLMLPSEGTQFSIAFLDSDAEDFSHNLKNLGTGVEQLLMTLVVGLTADARIVVLEEPETGLHPAAQRALLSLMKEWSGSGRVFAASTHSPVLLDWANTTTIFVARHGLKSTAVQVVDQQAGVLLDLGVRVSDILAAERILILEGVSDQEIMGIWFPQVIRDPRLAVIDGGGGDSARHAQILSSWLSEIDKIGGQKLLYIRDRDELPADFLAKLSGTRSVFVLPCRELENLLLDFEAIAKVLHEETGEGVSPQDLAREARGLAEPYKHVVIMKRVAGELGIHRYVDHRLRGRLASRRVGREDFAKEIVDRLPKAEDVRSQIDRAWERHGAEIEAVWDERWRDLTPGADLLDELWRRRAGRGYVKSNDGARIARAMAEPPASLRDILIDFMAG